jgi:PAS domain S-box-containing protein
MPRWSGALVMALGLVIIASWYARWQKILQLVPDTAPMQYNTAVCFILLGLGLILLTTGRQGAARWPGGVAALLGGLTLLEYVSGRDLGVDVLFFTPYFEAATTYPGRMSPLTAVCFICLGAALVVAEAKSFRSRRLAGTGLLACVVSVIGMVALGGYFFGIETAYGWGAYSRMAVNTAGALVVCGGGLLAWASRQAASEHYSFLRWLPATGSVTLMTMVGFVASENTKELREATHWREHTFQVILAGQGCLDNLLDMQRGLRGYVTLGDTNALAAYAAGQALEPQQMAQLAALTRDNASQGVRLERLGEALKELLAYDAKVMSVYQAQGYAGEVKLEATGEGRAVFGRVRDFLRAFAAEEEKLLVVRNATEEADSNKITRLLETGCGTAAVLLLAGNLMASREMKRRRQAEARLTATLTLQNAILSSADYAIVALDRHGIVKTFNPAAEKMLGHPAGEVIDAATAQMWSSVPAVPAPAPRIGMETSLLRAGLAGLGERETTFIRKDGRHFPVLLSTTALADARGEITGFLMVFSDISARKLREAEREKLLNELKAALAELKTISGLVPICSWCKNIRSDKGFWQTVEQFVHAKTHATFTHGICPKCAEKMMAGL